MTTSLPQISSFVTKYNNSNTKHQNIGNKRQFQKPIQQSIKKFIDNVNNKFAEKSQFYRDRKFEPSSNIYSKRLKQIRIKLFNDCLKNEKSQKKQQNAKINNFEKNSNLNQRKIQILKINQLNDFKVDLKDDQLQFKRKKKIKNQQNIINLKSYKQKKQSSLRLSLREIKDRRENYQNKIYLKIQTQSQSPKNKNLDQLKNLLKNSDQQINFTEVPKQQKNFNILEQEFSCYKNRNQIDYCKYNKDKYEKIKDLIMKKQRCKTSLQESQERLLNIQEAKIKKSFRDLNIQQNWKQKQALVNSQRQKLDKIKEKHRFRSDNYQSHTPKYKQKTSKEDNNKLNSLNKYKSARYSEIPHYEFLYLDDPIQQNEQQEWNLDKVNKKNSNVNIQNSKILNHVFKKESLRKLSQDQCKLPNYYQHKNKYQINRLRSKTSNKELY